ncbi:MAG: hypothetical protein ACREJ3_04545, partial [Polyangiaceae bacterium]
MRSHAVLSAILLCGAPIATGCGLDAQGLEQPSPGRDAGSGSSGSDATSAAVPDGSSPAPEAAGGWHPIGDTGTGGDVGSTNGDGSTSGDGSAIVDGATSDDGSTDDDSSGGGSLEAGAMEAAAPEAGTSDA